MLALEDTPEGLAELRGVLPGEQEGGCAKGSCKSPDNTPPLPGLSGEWTPRDNPSEHRAGL